jgi:hypothetical protein
MKYLVQLQYRAESGGVHLASFTVQAESNHDAYAMVNKLTKGTGPATPALMDNATYAAFLEIDHDNELIDMAKKIGVPIAGISDLFLDNTEEIA